MGLEKLLACAILLYEEIITENEYQKICIINSERILKNWRGCELSKNIKKSKAFPAEDDILKVF